MTYDPIPDYVVRVTFGVQYAQRPHPHLSWVHPDGYLEVVVTGAADEGSAYDMALDVIQRLTRGVYAFDYRPTSWNADDEHYYPLGVLARYQIDMRTTGTRFESFYEFTPRMVDVQETRP